MKDYLTLVQAVRPDAPRDIPVIDIGAFKAGEPGALAATAAEIRVALEEVGFYAIVNHGLPQALIDDAYAATREFFALPAETKAALARTRNNIGYLPIRNQVYRPSSDLNTEKPVSSAAESFFMKADLAPDHPDVVAGKRFRGLNQWPAEAALPGFRARMVGYAKAMEGLARSLLPLYAVAMDLEPGWFGPAFADPMYTLRISRYPRQEGLAEREQGLPPHTDTSFMTLLPYNRTQGLLVRRSDGVWIDAPAVPGSFVVNSGNLLRRWSNDRCMATPHQVINRSGEERYAMPFFFDCGRDWVMDCLPSCTSAENPFRYEPTTYADYMTWYSEGRYAEQAQVQAQAPAA